MPESNVVFVDGPLKGQVRCVESGPAYTEENQPLEPYHPGAELSPYGVTTEPKFYTIHTYSILGRRIRVGSIHLDSDHISWMDMFDALISDNAKKAVNPEIL
jgi:hypothetical protein